MLSEKNHFLQRGWKSVVKTQRHRLEQSQTTIHKIPLENDTSWMFHSSFEEGTRFHCVIIVAVGYTEDRGRTEQEHKQLHCSISLSEPVEMKSLAFFNDSCWFHGFLGSMAEDTDGTCTSYGTHRTLAHVSSHNCS